MFTLRLERQSEWLTVTQQAVNQQHNFYHVYQHEVSTTISVKASGNVDTNEMIVNKSNNKYLLVQHGIVSSRLLQLNLHVNSPPPIYN
jgi:hypothetical protein